MPRLRWELGMRDKDTGVSGEEGGTGGGWRSRKREDQVWRWG